MHRRLAGRTGRIPLGLVLGPRFAHIGAMTSDLLPPPMLSVRAVHRAVAELRRGVPVLLHGSGDALLIAAVEGLGAEGLHELHAAGGPATLLLAPVRAAALGAMAGDPGGVLAVRAGTLDVATLDGMADPTAAQILPGSPVPAPLPRRAASALRLAKLARLLPAVLAVPGDPAWAGARGLLSVAADDVDAHGDVEAGALKRVSEAAVPLEDAPDARVVAFRAPDGGVEHLAVVVGRPETVLAPLVRLHSECFTGDLLGSLRCDCGPQLRGALARIGAEGAGIVLYMAQEGRGIGIAGKLRAYALQDRGMDTLDANRALGWHADERNYRLAATMLRELGVSRVRLLTNNPDKVGALQACGVEVVSREPLVVVANGTNDGYLATKARRFGHLL